MWPATEEEQYLAVLLADALAGRLRITLADAPRLAAAMRRVSPERIAPMALAVWIGRDPRAGAVLDQLARLRRR
jgi:hypothetical protein